MDCNRGPLSYTLRMRKIYASPRIKNVEKLAAVMAEHGIATRITNVRAYDRSTYVKFSYARPGSSESWPSLWVIHAADHTRARKLVREIGIEPPVRFADELAEYRSRGRAGAPGRIAARVRTAALAALAIAMAFYAAKMIAVW